MLVVLVLACVAGNLWATASRTLVPVALSTRLVEKVRLAEKHPGLDDVILWRLEDGRTLQVDAPIDELAGRGARLEKAAGEKVLGVDGRPVDLPICDDVRGMVRVAGPVALAAVALAVAAARRRRPAVTTEA